MSTAIKIKSKPPDESQLILRLQSRDRRALEVIFDSYGSILLNVIKRIVRDEDIAEDVLQEVLLKVWNQSQKYDGSKGSLFTWLVTISKNSAIDKTKTKDFRLSHESKLSPELVSIEREDGNNDLERLYMKQVIDQLPPNQRKLIDLAYFQGYTQREISENLGLPLGTVKTRLRSALMHLRTVI
mgnify:CR=1 FL=1